MKLNNVVEKLLKNRMKLNIFKVTKTGRVQCRKSNKCIGPEQETMKEIGLYSFWTSFGPGYIIGSFCASVVGKLLVLFKIINNPSAIYF